MSESYIPAHLRRLVEQRANFECEYCQLPSGLSFFPHEIDHIILYREIIQLYFLKLHLSQRKTDIFTGLNYTNLLF